MLYCDGFPAKDGSEHEVAQVLIIDTRVHFKKNSRAAGRNERVVKFPIVSPQDLLFRSVSSGRALLQ
jgi:hypothetical protein